MRVLISRSKNTNPDLNLVIGAWNACVLSVPVWLCIGLVIYLLQ